MYLKFLFLAFIYGSFGVLSAPMTKDEGMNYLMNYGYLLNISGANPTDEQFVKALKEFQSTYSLPVTGQLNAETENLMNLPRCGRPDRASAFTNRRNAWNKRRLSYKFVNFPRNGLNRNVARSEIKRAFLIWAQQVPLIFEERRTGRVDIDIVFNPASRGDGPGKTLAYAYFPRVGDVYFDSENWTYRSRAGFNLFMVAAHEIGHSLGLEHSRVRGALLYPYIGPYNPNLRLHSDDIRRIQSLYGRKLEEINICTIDKLDAAVYSSKLSAVYLIRDNYVWKIKNNKVEENYPKTLEEEWPGSAFMVDAGFYYKDNIYLINKTDILMYDKQMMKPSIIYSIPDEIDAAEVAGTRVYLFKDSKYWRYEMTPNEMLLKTGYPKEMSSFWKDIPASVDAVYFDQNDFFYFFKDNTIYKFNINNNNMPTTMTTIQEWLSCL